MNYNYMSAVKNEDSPNVPSPVIVRNDGPQAGNPGLSDSHNTIYYYSEINIEKIFAFNKLLNEKSKIMLTMQSDLHLEQPPPLFVRIHSYGGSVFAGFSGMDTILNNRVPVTTIVDGAAASAATFLSIAGHKRYITENSFMLIHQLSSASWGKYRELQDDMKNNEMLMEKIRNIYAKYTKIPKQKISEILDHDLWFDAKTCLKYGLVDKII